ncbi:hypothetical protein LINPERHAP1_LOCUS2156, partial [Linum perenne]
MDTFHTLLMETEGLPEIGDNAETTQSGGASTSEASVIITDGETMTAAATSTSCLEITGFKNRKDPFNSRKRKKSCVEEAIFKKRQKQ